MAPALVRLNLDKRRTATRCKVCIHTDVAVFINPVCSYFLKLESDVLCTQQMMVESELGIEATFLLSTLALPLATLQA